MFHIRPSNYVHDSNYFTTKSTWPMKTGRNCSLASENIPFTTHLPRLNLPKQTVNGENIVTFNKTQDKLDNDWKMDIIYLNPKIKISQNNNCYT